MYTFLKYLNKHVIFIVMIGDEILDIWYVCDISRRKIREGIIVEWYSWNSNRADILLYSFDTDNWKSIFLIKIFFAPDRM